MVKHISIGVIVVHFGSKKDTIECLDSIQKTNHQNIMLEIYLVNNDSKNEFTKKDASSFKNIILLNPKKNLGFPGGINFALNKVLKKNYFFIFLINNDIIVKKDIFVKLIPYFTNKSIGLISPLIAYYDKPKIIWCTHGYLNRLFLFTTHPFMNKSLKSVILPQTIESDYAAACLLIRPSVFNTVGLFDERYFLYGEDVEWCLRVKKAGFKLLYITLPLALHKISATAGVKGTNILTPISAYYYARNFFIIMKDHNAITNLVTAFIGQTLIRLPFYVLFRIRSFHSATSYLKGYYHGLLYLLTSKLHTLQ